MLGSGFYYASGGYTPTITVGALSATGKIYGTYNVIGKMMFLKIYLYTGTTAGAGGTGTYTMPIPSGYTINQVASGTAPSGNQIVSIGASTISNAQTIGSSRMQQTSGAGCYPFAVYAYNSSSICAYTTSYNSAWFWGSGAGSFSLGQANFFASFECSFPVV